jgi:uncharacterized protein YcfL
MQNLRNLTGLFLIFICLVSCQENQNQTVENTKFNFLQTTRSIAEGFWLEDNFIQNLEKEKSIAKALKTNKNLLLFKIDYLSFRNDTLPIETINNKKTQTIKPLILRQVNNGYIFEFAKNTESENRMFLIFSVSSTDTVLQIKTYDTENKLIDINNYRKIKTLEKNSEIEKILKTYINQNLLKGSYSWGSSASEQSEIAHFRENSSIAGLDKFDKFEFLFTETSPDRLKLWQGEYYTIYEYNFSQNTVYLSKTEASKAGRMDYLLKWQYQKEAQSLYFSDEIVKLNIKDKDKELFIELKIEIPKDFPSGTDSLYQKIINAGFFNYKIFYQGKILEAPAQLKKYNLGKLYTESAYFFFTELGQKQPAKNYVSQIKIPKYAFKELGTGEHELSLYIYQRPYSQAFEERKKSSLNMVYIDKKEKWLWAKLRFKIKVPVIYTNIIELQEIHINRHANVDFSLKQNGGTADIFWAVFYPENTLFWQSKVSKSSSVYKNMDVVEIYSYEEYPLLSIGVFDHDMGAKSEIIGKTKLSTIEIPAAFKNFRFDKVDALSIRKLD